MIPKLLKERSDYENSLIDVPIELCFIEKINDWEIIFKNKKTGNSYYGKIYYENNVTSALINILMKTVLKYSGWEVNSLDDTINILNHLQGVVLINYIKYPLYLRLDKNREIYGIVGKYYNATNKEYIFNKIYKPLISYYGKLKTYEHINKFNQIEIYFKDLNDNLLFTTIFGNDTGHSRYRFINNRLGRNGYWDHNMSAKSFHEIVDFVLGIDYISELELTEMKNFNMN